MDSFILDMTISTPVQPNRRVTVVHLITSLDNGGAEAMLAKVVGQSDRDRFHHVVIALKGKGFWGKSIEASGIELHALGMATPWSLPLAFVRLYLHLKRIQPDILQTWLYHADFLGTLVRWVLPIPKLVWNFRCSNMDLKQYPFHTQFIFKVLAKLSSIPDVIFINSNKGLSHHQDSGFHPRRWHLIPNGFDTSHFAPNESRRDALRQELGLPLNARLITFPARYDVMKDHETFVRAARIVADARDDVYFLLAGKDVNNNNKPLTQLIAELSLQTRVLLLGQRNDIENFLPAVDIVGVSSAFGEGFPNVLGEAMACAIPCVASDVGDIREIAGQTGIIVPPRSPQEMADAWMHTLDLPRERLQELGAMARNRIRDNYSIETVTAMYETMYEELTAPGTAAIAAHPKKIEKGSY